MAVQLMTHAASLLAGFALGRFLDPNRGRRRRAVLRDKVVSAGHAFGHAAGTTARDVRNRSRGVLAALRPRGKDVADDRVIAERVRARVGGVSSHPGAIDVTVRDGTVTLRGPVLADEIPAVVRAVTAVRGVVAVDDLLDAHLEAGDVPALQGVPTARHEPERTESQRRPWSPTARLLGGVAGAAAAVWGLRRTSTIGTLAGGAGLVLVARAASNVEMTRLFGLGAGHDAVTLQKTIEVGAPIEDVWDLWSRYEELPRFMSHVRSVRRADDGSSHWTVDGPGGVPLTWHTVETLRVPRETLAWKTIAGAPVAHAGMVQFAPTPSGTRIHVRFHYTPPAGALGHALAAMLGADPKRAMDEDLVRFKSLLEEGATTAHRRTVRRDELH